MKLAQSYTMASYLDRLRELPFVKGLTVEPEPDAESDGRLRVRTPRKSYPLRVELKSRFLEREEFERLVVEMARRGSPRDPPWILMAPAVSASLGQELAAHGLNYVDRQGNCRVALGKEYLALVEGRRAEPVQAVDKAIRAPGYQTLFALLARPRLIDSPLRTIASEAGVSRQAAVDALARLVSEGAIVETKRGYRWLPKGWGEALDRWLVGYRSALRPRWLVGRYRAQERDPEALERRLQPVLDTFGGWRWGGTAAGFRLTGHYRGPRTVVYLQRASESLRDLPRTLKALPDAEGPLVIVGVPATRVQEIAFDGRTPDTVHPLLVYAEMVIEGDERALEAAAELREKYLTPP